jgi:hypothetical protein
MSIPFLMSDEQYVKVMYSKVSKGTPLYRHIPPERLLNARWILHRNVWVSDFGGLGYLYEKGSKIIFPHIAVWKKIHKVLIYNKHLSEHNFNINIYVPSVVYKVFNGFPEDQILTKSNIELEFDNNMFWDCRVENLSLRKDEGYGLSYDDF